jgi:hypothetical protein
MRMLLLIALSQTVYRWTDERGVMHYSDDRAKAPSDATIESNDAPPRNPTAASPATIIALPPLDEKSWRAAFAHARNAVRSLELKVQSETAIQAPAPLISTAPSPSRGIKFSELSETTRLQIVCVAPSNEKPELSDAQNCSDRCDWLIAQRHQRALQTAAALVDAALRSLRDQPHVSDPSHAARPETPRSERWVRDCAVHIEASRDRRDLAAAGDALQDLERRAANAAVPLEWRR